MMLEVRNVTKRFGGLVAVDDVTLTVERNEILGLIGPNGAGKTTLFNMIAGVFPATAGSIYFKGEQVDNKRADETCHLGLARTFQIPQIFGSMTVGETIIIGGFLRDRSIPKVRRKAKEIAEAIGLGSRFDTPTASLTTAERKRLEVARALATEPDMILLDEVMAGLNPTEVNLMLDLVTDLRNSGVTVLFVEHNLSAVMRICDRIAVLDHGAKIADGKPREVMDMPAVVEAYLGAPTDQQSPEDENVIA